MPAIVETVVFTETVDEAIRTSVIEGQHTREREREEGIRC